jgi:hypothetical protein
LHSARLGKSDQRVCTFEPKDARRGLQPLMLHVVFGGQDAELAARNGLELRALRVIAEQSVYGRAHTQTARQSDLPE